ncbi:MAG: YIP1 family protein [Caldilineaceae bacterium]|nr:YIP1 family protein [Caldilineaceae bacterium]
MNIRHWLPTPQKMSDAVQLRASGFTETTMRQSLGMVFLLGLLAGFLPFLVNWQQAASAGTALPLARLGAQASLLQQTPLDYVFPLFSPAQIVELFQLIAGLPQPLPGWLAAFFSALGEWINWPLRWLALWIVYGALVMVCNSVLGATCRLQPFFAATGFASAPLLLVGLSPIPCFGRVCGLVGVIWAFVVYIRANEEVTHLPRLRSLAAVLLPLLFILIVTLSAIALVLLSVYLFATGF